MHRLFRSRRLAYRKPFELVFLLCLSALPTPINRKGSIRGRYYAIGSDNFELLRGTYNSLLHAPRDSDEDLGSTSPMGTRVALNPDLDWEAIEKEYLSKDLPLVWFDG